MIKEFLKETIEHIDDSIQRLEKYKEIISKEIDWQKENEKIFHFDCSEEIRNAEKAISNTMDEIARLKDLKARLVPSMPRIHWKHINKYGVEYCAMCEYCNNVVYYNYNEPDYFCSRCGKEQDWNKFLEKYKDEPDTRNVIKELEKLTRKNKNGKKLK